ncbi:MAG TPA: TetR/AcrR family transcriptional regulator [Polyangiaceae bacterium]|nr:TetR/AcrR family transcriptional regulator [Polyangiaceae bacterium]
MGELRRASEVRQVELTDAALHIIATKGIAALSTRSLAEHVGLTSGAIFRHFPSIEALLDAVVTRVDAVLESTYPPSDLSARERLERFVAARSAAIGSHVGILRLVLSEQFLLALPEGGSLRLTACVRKTREFLRQCIHEGQAEGELRGDIDADALAVVVMGTIQMLALSKAPRRQRLIEAHAVQDALAVLLEPPATRAKSLKRRERSK